MSNFFRAHWKAIVAIVLLVLLATVTVNPRAMPSEPTPAARLRTHVAVLAAGQPGDAGGYIEHVLRLDGYAVHSRAGHGARRIEAARANVAPGARAARSFIVGARYDGGGAPTAFDADEEAGGSAAVLELAHLLKDVQPAPGTEIRFVFFLDARGEARAGAGADAGGEPDAAPDTRPAGAGDAGNFVAYVGTLASSRQVRDALSAFQGLAGLPSRGLAVPAYLQGVTLADRASWQRPGGAAPALVITDTAFTRFPYRHAEGDDPGPNAAPDERVYASMARVVGALARTLMALAAGQQY